MPNFVFRFANLIHTSIALDKTGILRYESLSVMESGGLEKFTSNRETCYHFKDCEKVKPEDCSCHEN